MTRIMARLLTAHGEIRRIGRCHFCGDVPGECDPEIPCCDAKGPGGFGCTREPGHDGDHVACGIIYHDVKRWPA